jgi:hypothetical protein
MGSYHAACILCDTNGVQLYLADLYRQQRQLAIHSAPPRSQFVDPMSSAASFNASNKSPHEAPLQLPPCYHDSPALIALSPCTVETTLQTQPDIDATLLRNIANGLLQTITNREAATAITMKQYEDQIHHLKERVLHYEDTFNEPPTGYTLNNSKVTNFHIPVRLNEDGTVSGYHAAQGPNEQPHIIDLYPSPDFSVDSPLEALPNWFRYMLTRLGGDFQILQQAVADTDDWGLAREIACFRELNNDITAIAIKIEQYQRDLNAACARLGSCELCLMLAHASKRVTTLQNIPRKVGTVRSGWKRGSHMPCDIHVRTMPLEDE